ncbi:hypothetical protein ABTX81_19965 [Kitasatospora sp. NPDC097605]|uniref:hypothetical protein n=1 Tax=Kitasatospora sp. NPDC097605 TaxID=3157226 RepID=UPI00332F3E0F
MSSERTDDPAAEARLARFGRLPERIRFEDMTEEVPPGPGDGPRDTYHPDGVFRFYNCLAADFGL